MAFSFSFFFFLFYFPLSLSAQLPCLNIIIIAFIALLVTGIAAGRTKSFPAPAINSPLQNSFCFTFFPPCLFCSSIFRVHDSGTKSSCSLRDSWVPVGVCLLGCRPLSSPVPRGRWAPSLPSRSLRLTMNRMYVEDSAPVVADGCCVGKTNSDNRNTTRLDPRIGRASRAPLRPSSRKHP